MNIQEKPMLCNIYCNYFSTNKRRVVLIYPNNDTFALIFYHILGNYHKINLQNKKNSYKEEFCIL